MTTDSTRRYRTVVVGCGARGRDHVAAYGAVPEAEIVACCAPTPQRREALAAEFGLRAYDDPAEMIRREKPDLVHLVTWPDVRLPLMQLVSDLGVPACTVEKPIATGVEDWRALREIAATTRTKFAVCHQVRWQRYLTRCRAALESGRLGAVRFLDFTAGMNVSGQGTHILNYAISLNGESPVTQVFGTASGAAGMSGGHPAPDGSQGYLIFANGVRGVWVNGPTAPRCGDPATEWQHVRVAAYAERGTVRFEEFGTWEITGEGETERGDYGGMNTWRVNNIEAQSAFHRAMLAWIEDDTARPGTHLEQSLHEWKVVLALYASALERRPIDIASFEPEPGLFARLREALSASTPSERK